MRQRFADTVAMPPLTAVKLLDQVRERVRYLHYSIRTEEAYVYWIRGFIRFHGTQHPRDMGITQIEQYLSHLATERLVAASTHKQALLTCPLPAVPVEWK